MSPLLAQSGHELGYCTYLLLGVKRTWLVRHLNLKTVGCDADNYAGEQRHPLPSLVLGNLLAIANYEKALAIRIRSVFSFAHKSLLGWRAAHISRLKISHRLFAARCVAAIID